jgi:putative transposase
MDNHYHLLLETADGNRSKDMRQLNGIYAQRCKRRHGRVGQVFQGRYQAIIVQREPYLLELARHIVLNPARGRLIRHPEQWPWSSYRATTGIGEPPPWLATDGLLGAFPPRRDEAIQRYAAFVADGKYRPAPREHLRNPNFLVSESFVASMQCWVEALAETRRNHAPECFDSDSSFTDRHPSASAACRRACSRRRRHRR